MKPRSLTLLLVILAGGCAMQGTLQRESVEYNSALSGMADQLTLLNIIRAKDDMPIYYTTVSRITGQIVVTTAGGFNATLKTASPTNTTASTNAIANNTGTTTTNMTGTSGSVANATTRMSGSSGSTTSGMSPTTAHGTTSSTGTSVTNTTGTTTALTSATATMVTDTVTEMATRAVTSGGNLFVPSLSGQLVSGPTFDINILDTQAFYNGILTEIPFSIVDNYIDQDYNNQLLMRLLVDRFEFRLTRPMEGYRHPAGTVVKTLRNVAYSPNSTDEAKNFADESACFILMGVTVMPPIKTIVPLSRVTMGGDGKVQPLKIQDLAAFDGSKLDIDNSITNDPNLDSYVQIVRPTAPKRVPTIEVKEQCPFAKRNDDTTDTEKMHDAIPATPPADAILVKRGNAKVLYAKVLDDSGSRDVDVPVDVFPVFRSPEGVIKFVGQYLYFSELYPSRTYRLGLQPLFSIREGHSSTAVVSAEVLGKHYYIADDKNRRLNMQVVALIEQLVNLQKSATERPTVLPVQVVP
jgi:hypothetical protein